jgi:hypothetical protein
MERDGLFIDDLVETLSRVRAAPAAESAPDVTTQALGEEGDQPDDGVATTDALGEEGDQPDDAVATTQALGEEGDQPDDGVATTDALGEEGDQPDDAVVTTQALGEEGDQADDQPIEPGWGSSSAENDLFLDEPFDSCDDFDPFDTAL